jgi:hypothetical protein
MSGLLLVQLQSFVWSRGSLVGIATGYILADRGIVVRERVSSLFHSVKTSFEAHRASYQIDTGGSYPSVKMTGGWIWIA